MARSSATSNSSHITRSGTLRSYHEGLDGKKNVPQLRSKIAKAMASEMHQCPDWATFNKHYIPFTPCSAHIDSALHKLEGSWLTKNKQGEWTWQNLPVDRATENVYFTFLVDLCTKLKGFVDPEGGRVKPYFTLVHNPDSTAKSALWGATHKIDGSFYLQEEEDGYLCHQAVANEYKKSPSKTSQNREQLLADVTYAMNENPRRMFMYGMTIEGNTARVWYFSRSHSSMSGPCNWRESPKDFITVLLAFIFATPKELGYDPAVHRRLDPDGSEYFIYEVTGSSESPERLFRTIKSLSEYHSLCISGRSTRVWLVQEVKSLEDPTFVDSSKPCVLKDIWVDKESKTEREVLDEILDDIRALSKSGLDQSPAFQALPSSFQEVVRSQAKVPEQHFLSIECDATGHVSLKPAPGSSVAPQLFGKSTPAPRPPYSVSSSRARSSSNYPEGPTSAPPPSRTYNQKKQYRVVFREVCEPMHSVKSFRSSMQTIRDAIVALALMFLVDFVHRDISGGNLLWYQDGNRGILGDLEYTKPLSSTSSSGDPKTGTPFFMAQEILTQKTIFSSRDPNWKEPPINHNPLHDAESAWWAKVWTLVRRIPGRVDTQFFDLVFRNTLNCSAERMMALSDSDRLFNELRACKLGVPDALLADVADTQEVLYATYKTNENIREPKAYGVVYDAIYRLCSKSMEIDLELEMFPPPDAATGSKRKRAVYEATPSPTPSAEHQSSQNLADSIAPAITNETAPSTTEVIPAHDPNDLASGSDNKDDAEHRRGNWFRRKWVDLFSPDSPRATKKRLTWWR